MTRLLISRIPWGSGLMLTQPSHQHSAPSSCLPSWKEEDAANRAMQGGGHSCYSFCRVPLWKTLSTGWPFKIQEMSSRAPIWNLNVNTWVPLLLMRVYVSSRTLLLLCTFSGCHISPHFPSTFGSVTGKDVLRPIIVIIYYSTLPTVSK